MRKAHAPSRRLPAVPDSREVCGAPAAAAAAAAGETEPKAAFPKFRSPLPEFRSPLAGRAGAGGAGTRPDASSSSAPSPVAKKPKVSNEGAGAPRSRSAPSANAGPDAVPVAGRPHGRAVPFDAAADSPGSGEKQPACYNVMWRKPSKKKHKSWDGDGILVVCGKRCVLYNKDGSQIGPSAPVKFESLSEGDLIVVGAKEVEVDCKFDTSLYTSGRCFMASLPSLVAPAPRTPYSKFKLDSGLAGASGAVRVKPVVAIPRHNPDAENALIMPKPSAAHELLWNKKKRPVTDVIIDPILCVHLRPHQREGVKFLYECVMGYKEYDGCGAILADEMGLGKTLQTITLLWTLMKQTPYYGDAPAVGRALVVCPATLTQNWKKEFQKWLGDERIRVFVVDQKTELRDFLLGRIYSVLVIGYEKLRALQEILKDAKFDIVICDEGHRLKSTSIRTTQSFSKITTRRRIILSGTPMQNDLSEFFAMVNFVNPSVFPSYGTFKNVYEDPILNARQPDCDVTTLELGKQRSEELSRLTKMFILRRTSEVNASYLPPKVEIVLFCRPTRFQVTAYKSILASSALQSAVMGDSSQHLVCISTLRKICNAPETFLADDSQECAAHALTNVVRRAFEETKPWNPELGSKLKLLETLLSNLRSSTSEKIVVVSSFTKTLDVIQAMCDSYNWGYYRLDGSTPTMRRQEYVDAFNKTSSEKFVFLLSARSGGVGLNLIGASRLVLFDVDWNPSVDLQAMARIHRENQKRKVYLYRFITTGTIEEKIFQRQITKLSLGSSIIDDNASENADRFSLEELRDLFTLHEDTDCLTHDLLDCTCWVTTASKVTSVKQLQAKENMNEYLNQWSHISHSAWSRGNGGRRAAGLSGVEDSERSQCSLAVGDDVVLSRTLTDANQKPNVSFVFLKQS